MSQMELPNQVGDQLEVFSQSTGQLDLSVQVQLLLGH